MSFVVSVKDLMKHPGNMKEIELTTVLEAEIGTPVVKLPKGQTLEIDLRLESVHEGILASGSLHSDAQAICSRCLEEISLEIEVEFQELFAYSSSSDDELVVDGETIDLEQIVIDSVVLNLPFQPLCSQDCLGLCAECGVRLSENPGHEHEKPIDSRFSALKSLQSKEE